MNPEDFRCRHFEFQHIDQSDEWETPRCIDEVFLEDFFSLSEKDAEDVIADMDPAYIKDFQLALSDWIKSRKNKIDNIKDINLKIFEDYDKKDNPVDFSKNKFKNTSSKVQIDRLDKKYKKELEYRDKKYKKELEWRDGLIDKAEKLVSDEQKKNRNLKKALESAKTETAEIEEALKKAKERVKELEDLLPKIRPKPDIDDFSEEIPLV